MHTYRLKSRALNDRSVCERDKVTEMTAKEIFLELLKEDGRPERQLIQYEALQMALGDPIGGYLHMGRRPGATITDLWGTVVDWPADAPGSMPIVTAENKVIKDITHWRDYVHAPDIVANCSNEAEWSAFRSHVRELAGDERLVAGFMATGIFEQCHFLMPFQEVLTSLYDHPDEMHELIDYITEFRLTYVKTLIDNLQPDVIFSHDDWGTKDALFMNPDTWREFYKEPYRRFYGYIRSRGVIAIHHADSYLAPIVEDMAEIGIQVWQGVLPENDIPALQRRLKGRMVLMGGIGAAIDREDAGEEEVRNYVHDALHEYCPGGHYIPSITYGLAGTVYKHVDPWIDDEIRKYNAGYHLPRYTALTSAADITRPVRFACMNDPESTDLSLISSKDAVSGNVSAAISDAGEMPVGSGTLLDAVSEALQDGSVSATCKAVESALEAGISAQSILTDGLVRGMNELGEDFSLGEVFVPEMLRAANCMSSATEILKPLLTSDNEVRAAGKVCLGTVRGDLHDIGKNLVKIMMEGSGLEVIDAGCDVGAEDFVQMAIDNNCGMIACSTLLTTSMGEIERVVQEAVNRGIRDKVKILIGGAPVTQEFCDKVGADAYTPDAAAAARKAVQLLS